MHRAIGATPTQTDARSILIISADENGRTRTFSDAEIRRPVKKKYNLYIDKSMLHFFRKVNAELFSLFHTHKRRSLI
jgi:hypothetical protein